MATPHTHTLPVTSRDSRLRGIQSVNQLLVSPHVILVHALFIHKSPSPALHPQAAVALAPFCKPAPPFFFPQKIEHRPASSISGNERILQGKRCDAARWYYGGKLPNKGSKREAKNNSGPNVRGEANLNGACLWISINNLWLHLPSAIELGDKPRKKKEKCNQTRGDWRETLLFLRR